MTPETQEKLIDLARRGAKCEAWAQWCKMALERSATTGGLDVNDRRVKSEYRPAWHYIGPIPSCTYTDDQLGEFLERAGVFECEVALYLDSYDHEIGSISIRDPALSLLLAAITIVERAHRLGEYAHYSEIEAAPYMVAFNKGVGR